MLLFLKEQFLITPPYPKDDVSGQTFIVTGASSGLGLECARHLTRMNAEKVILAVRTTSKGEAAKKSIEESTGKKGTVEVWLLDLSSYDSVKEFVKKADGLQRLDCIIENAGVSTKNYTVAEDNETTITTNVVSTFLLALLILPKLQETAEKFHVTPRLVVTSSEVHMWTNLAAKNTPGILETLNNKETAIMKTRYFDSKLLEVFYCRELAARMNQSSKPKVTVNYLNPGLCHSGLIKDDENNILLRIMLALAARSTEVGSRTLVASATAGHESHGQYMSCSEIREPSEFVRSEEGKKTQQRVWDEVNAKLEKIQPGILMNV